MAVLRMTPCELYQGVKGQSYIDDDGNKHPGTIEFQKYTKCDVVPSGAAAEKDFGDGVLQTYSYVIFIYNKKCRNFVIGERIKFKKDGQLSGEYLVKGFHRYQHQCKIWI